MLRDFIAVVSYFQYYIRFACNCKFLLNFTNHHYEYYSTKFTLGGALIKVGNAEAKIGIAEREFVETSARKFIKPCKSYVENDCKSINVCIVLRFSSLLSYALIKN